MKVNYANNASECMSRKLLISIIIDSYINVNNDREGEIFCISANDETDIS